MKTNKSSLVYYALFICMLPMLSTSYVEKFKNSKLPSNKRNILLYSKHGHYLAIYPGGTVNATIDTNSTSIVLEMQTFGRYYKRIRRPGSYYLAINNQGEIVTRKKPRKNTLFREHFDGSYFWYENDANQYILALRANYRTKNKVKATNHTRPKHHIKKTQFLIAHVPYRLQKLSEQRQRP
ncbi:fibroblast growth factor 1-like [Hydractinia symbiolongicarpus]|uniref:fibroblast growth factor 1-like n=1 Tax=Hydractinia symbiolongicarpus TaxID=13093 RepID=UPI00254F6011|nr:fibroblast growth factor 1-like [Hydractinia symbiolongicarpus]